MPGDNHYIPGADERVLLALERDYGMSLAEISRRNMLQALAQVIREQGIKDSAELQAIVSELLLIAQEEINAVQPAVLNKHEAKLRRRLHLFRNEFQLWLLRERERVTLEVQDKDEAAKAAQRSRIQYKYIAVDSGAPYEHCEGWDALAQQIDALEGLASGSTQRYCKTDPTAARMLDIFRPVRLHASHIASADALSAMASVLLNTAKKERK